MEASLLAMTKSIFWFWLLSCLRNLLVVSQCKNRSCVLHLILFGYFMTSAVATVLSILFVHNLPRLSRFPYHEAFLARSIYYSPMDRMLVHRRVTPLSSMSPVLIYTPWWREIKWSKVPCIRKRHDGQGLNPRRPDPEFEVLTPQSHMPPQ